MPKLLIVIARLNKGGTAQYIGQLATQLPKHGYKVLVATGQVQGQEIEDEITKTIPIARIKHLGRKISPINDLKARKKLKNLIKEFKPDLIYSHTFKAGAITRTIKTDTPIIHAFHGHLLDEPELAGIKIKIATAIERKLAPKAEYLVTVGKKVAQDLQKAGVGTKSQYISIAPGVVPLKLENKTKARKSLGIEKEKRPIIVWLARVVAVKGPERVIELAKKFPNARFLMAGGGDLLQSIKNQAPENLFVLGWKDAKELWSVADIAISTSENEGMPIALIEAQLAGIPVIALDAGSVSEVIDQGKTGFVVKEFNEKYFQYLNQLLKDKKLRNKFGKEAKKRAQKEFDPGRLIQDHLKLFQKAI
jgi:glycosyltransferase involved in cell wall biosynthesis